MSLYPICTTMAGEDADEIVHVELDTDEGNPAIQIVESVSDVEETAPAELPTMYDCVDGILDKLFSHPPDPRAQMEIEFNYGSYRVTIDQGGNLKLVEIR